MRPHRPLLGVRRASTNVEYTLTVTDLVAGGAPAVYHHPGGPPAPAINDVEALPCP